MRLKTHSAKASQASHALKESRWLVAALVFAIATLILQLLPIPWGIVVWAISPNNWTWRAFAVGCAMLIMILVALRGYRNQP